MDVDDGGGGCTGAELDLEEIETRASELVLVIEGNIGLAPAGAANVEVEVEDKGDG